MILILQSIIYLCLLICSLGANADLKVAVCADRHVGYFDLICVALRFDTNVDWLSQLSLINLLTCQVVHRRRHVVVVVRRLTVHLAFILR